MTGKVFLINLILVFCAALPKAFANGYDDYPPDLAWSSEDEVLAAALEDRLVIWTPLRGEETILEGEVASPAFSPDGEYVAFVLDGLIDYFPVDDHRFISIHSRRIEAVACTFDPLSDPDDPVLCYTTRFLGSDIYIKSLFSSDMFLLLPEDSEARVNAPVISPDGSNIACMNFDTNPTWYEELYIIGSSAPLGRRARTDQTFNNWTDWHESNPVWITDRVLLFQVGGWGEWELRFLNIDSGIDKFFLDNASQATVSGSGELVAFCRIDPLLTVDFGRSWEDPTTVWIMNRDTGNLIQASEMGEWAIQPALSPDGRYIAWIEVTRNGERLKVHETEEFI